MVMKFPPVSKHPSPGALWLTARTQDRQSLLQESTYSSCFYCIISFILIFSGDEFLAEFTILHLTGLRVTLLARLQM